MLLNTLKDLNLERSFNLTQKPTSEKKIKNMILLIIQSMKVIIFRNAEEITKKASNIATQIENQTEEKI